MPDSIIKADNISSLSGEGVGFPNGTISNPSMKFTNSNTTGLYRPSANQLGLVTNGIERLRIDSNGQVSSVIPNGITLYNQFMCRAWVNFDGTRNVDNSGSSTNGQPVFIKGSGNISSITKNGTGDYTLNFTTAMPDTNYAFFVNNYLDQTTLREQRGSTSMAINTNSLRFTTITQSTSSPEDEAFIFVSIFR